MDVGCRFHVWIFIYFLFLIKVTEQNTRQKRQISAQQPKLSTQNGHLVFQTGVNHNISFKSSTGGFINVNGENLNVIAQTVKDNKQAIDELKTQPTEIPSNIESRLSNVEQRLNNLQPTGEVQSQLATLTDRLDTIEGTVNGDVTNRLTTVENTVSSLSSLTSSVSDLTSRVASLESSVSSLQDQIASNSEVQALTDTVNGLATATTPSPTRGLSRAIRRGFRRVRNRVNTLRQQVNSISNLLNNNECNSNPCRNGGTCLDKYNGFQCRCPNAWQGPTCQDDVNECSIYAGTDLACQNGATCVNTVGSFTCRCSSNWHGLRCRQQHDDCTGASDSELCGHGACLNNQRTVPGQPKYTCICEIGWTHSGSDPACSVDVNECEERQRPCSVDPPVQCINVPGTFYCGQCPTGYSGNGFNCVDINECLINNGGCSLAPRVDCINTEGSRSCSSCPSGFVGDGVTCTWVGVCGVNNGGCYPQASCVESPGIQGRVCTCPPGYVGNGVGPVGCVAQGPVSGACTSNPCRNGASCQPNGASYVCVCRPGYTDQQCQTNINECASSPCQNGGTCVDQINGYMCQCTGSNTGTNCEQEQQSCGGRLYGETGSFTYPTEIGANYPHGVSCAWRIQSSPGKIIKANFSRFNVEYHASCSYDFLQINDGPSAASYALGKFCGTNLPNDGYPINSTQHFMYFWFFSDSSVSNNGFAVGWTSETAVCGGSMTGATHGSINSPGYPGNYPHDRTCVWQVTVPPGNNIMFTFATIALESHPNCSYDYLELRDGHSDTAPLLQRFCSSVTPAPLTTTSPDAYIKFHSDASLSDQGFHITYVAVSAGTQCGGTRTQTEGIILSPNYPSPYDHNGQCVWTIVAGTSTDFITLTFTNMNLESSSSCQYDFVELRDGQDEDSPLLGRYCGYSVPAPRSSSGNSMFIRFSSDGSMAGTGFRATYSVDCGGYFSASSGTLQSPNYPLAYPRNKQCIFRITARNGNAITLTFNAFHLEGGSCSFDYLQVRDGSSEDSALIGSFCGTQIPGPLTTTQRTMWIKFVTDGSVQNTGFQATYIQGPIMCGGQLTSDTGSFTSPGHPNVYPHGVNCTWSIRVSPGLVIRLSFSSFHLEGSGTCYYDYVDIYDNSSVIEGSRIGRYCGNNSPPTTTSTDNVMVVTFKADGSVAHTGFSASYVTLNASTVCGRTLTQPTGIITSPNYPSTYPHERECIWTISAPPRMQILLNVTDFSLESHYRCNYDYLEIRNGGFATSPLVGKYCGNTIDRIIRSHSNKMFLKFKSDISLTRAGFRITYDATASGCGGDLTTPTGSFVSPNYPMNYHHRSECFWKIVASRGSRLNLTFSDFALEGGSSCYFDYVEVREMGPTGSLIGKYCGSQIPAPILSNTSTLWIKYKTDSSVSRRGFYASYSTDCNNRLIGYSGVIESPNFPNPYPHNRNCTWILQTSMGNTLNVSFSHFTLESHRSCMFDYLQVRDGQQVSSRSLGKFCGNRLPPALASTTQYLMIQFLSDYSVAQNGFRLEYLANGCGGYLTRPTGTLTSPEYPNNYPHRRVCEWSIVLATGYSIQLNITDFDFETHHTCAFDGLDVYGGVDDTSPQLVSLCHKQTTPQVLTSTGNMMFVRFRSDISISGRGFSANYRSIVGGCGGNFSVPSATIFSKNYPNNYPRSTECLWRITVAAGRSVELTFQDFHIERSSTCGYDSVKVYDGNSLTSPLLMTHCGNALPSPPVITSTGNQMLVRMTTDSSVNYSGFKAKYVTGCGGTLNSEVDGVLTSPNYPGNYEMNHNCSWLITTDHEDDRVTLTFTHMDIEEETNCIHDYVRVYNGNDDDAPVIGTYCGTTVPPPITSLGSMMFVRFSSDLSVQKTGFRALYTKSSSSCGGDFTAERGSFMSPGYPESYPHNVECVWTFRISPGNKLAVSFSVFNIENHEDCSNDYLEVRETDVNGRLIGRYCGNQIPSNVRAANGVWIKFRSDNASTGVGFLGQYTPEYGGNVIGTSGQISSPLYPRQYPHSTDYVWTVTVDVSMRIRVIFVTMDMEYVQRGCVYDYVKFLDGGAADSAEMGRYCGITLPDPFMTTGNQLRVEFHSDISSSGQGFLFNWEATSDQIPTTPPSTTPVPGCGGNRVVTPYITRRFTSPGYPDGYAHNLNCLWQIVTFPGYIVWFNITDINIESHSACNYDVLSVYDGILGTERVLGTYCGRIGNDQPLLSTTNAMSARFTTDSYINRTGFSVDIQAVCGGLLRTPTGMIMSPVYPSNYTNTYNNNSCTWIIVVAVGRTIEITFNSTFNVAGNPGDCDGSYIQLLNGNNVNAPPLGNGTNGRYCGNSAPPVMETSSNALVVVFATDNIGSETEFQMTYREVSVTCGGHLTLTNSIDSGYFMSPSYPTYHPHNLDCVWVITSPAGTRIQVDFVGDFNIEMHPACNFDFIEMRDGGTSNSAQIGRFCGTTLPSTVKSTGNVMFARFRTDSSVSRVGFKAQYKIATCGGRLNGRRGVVSSPNYPSNYPSNVDCEWIVRGPTGHFLTLSVESYRLNYAGGMNNCTSNGEYLEIRDINITGPVLLNGCGYGSAQSLQTSDSYAFIKFKSNSQPSNRGFRLTFQASVEECGGDLMAPSGIMTSPNFPGQYAHSRICEWRIRVQEGRRVTLTFDTFNLEAGNARCPYDYVAVYNGILSDSPRIVKLCGGTLPDPVDSSGNTMKIIFRTDGSVTNGGFRASYNSQNEQKCGGRLTANNGNISSPGYFTTGSYGNNTQCIWIISNRNVSDTSMYLRFMDLKLEHHTTCFYDLLEIREGNSENGDLIRKYCGNDTNLKPIFSPSPDLWVRFKTDLSIVDKGFVLVYEFTDCGGILTSDNGYITSPNYPNKYNDSSACTWLIQAPEGYRINVLFTDFHLERHSACSFDSLKIQNGGLPSSPEIGIFCGNSTPADFKSQSNAVRVTFESDYSITAQGFRLTYNFESGGCGGLYHSNEGRLMSPNYPRSYPHNTECVWDINVNSGYHLVLNFIPPFDLQAANCQYDYVEVSDWISQDNLVPRGRWCSNLTPPQQNSSSSRIVVKFRSDSSTNGNGFAANWTVGCGAQFTGDRGRLVSPGYPARYTHNLMCNYTITSDPQKFILLSFASMVYEIEGGANCPYDYLAVYSGNDTSGQFLGKFCGNTIPQPVSSLGRMFIQFVTDGSVAGRGWELSYATSECGGNYTEPYGIIKTPQQPSQYHHNANCTWLITVETDRVVSLRFTAFELEAHSRCLYDYVEIRDGSDLTAHLIGRYCGNTIPKLIMSTGNVLIVNFISDYSVSRAGFSAAYRTTYGVDQGCGGVLNSTSGSFGSVDGDGDGTYENNLDCMWTIIVGDNKIIRLNIDSMNIESYRDCYYDYIKIFDGLNEESPSLGTYCGTNAPGEIKSTSNVLYVIFHSDPYVTRAGFNATYVQEDALCGGTRTATAEPQTITSPGYPSPSQQSLRCRWTIDAPEDNLHVRFSVTALNLITDSFCASEYIEFRDFPMGDTGRSMHYCGTSQPETFDSYGRTAQVNYAVSGNSGSQGFSMTYQIATCNKSYSGDSGQIYSPGWPGNYPINVFCEMLVTGPVGTYVALYFNFFRIETHQNCLFDYLEIRNGSNSSAPVITQVCGSVLPDPVFATGNSLWLTFSTDRSVRHRGYDITYTATTQGMGCGGNITGINGSFTSPGYPGNYTERHNCRWLISVPARRMITARFTDLNLIGSPDCNRDYVEVYNGESDRSPVLGRFCGNESPAPIPSTGSKLCVKFVTDGVGSAPGFRLTYTS